MQVNLCLYSGKPTRPSSTLFTNASNLVASSNDTCLAILKPMTLFTHFSSSGGQQLSWIRLILWLVERWPLLVGAVIVCLPVIAQPIISTLPAKNANNVSTNTAVQVTASQSFSTGQSLLVFSTQAGGHKAGNTIVVGPSLTFSPTEAFRPGEVVSVSVPTQPHFVFQFTTAVKAGGGQFSGSTEVGVGNHPNGVATGDVDGDGDLDLLTVNANDNSVSIRLNDGLGNFSGKNEVSVDYQPISLAIGDVDGDGDLDFLTANAGTRTVSVRLNDGQGNFTGNTTVIVGLWPFHITLADVDGDGDLDFLTADIGDQLVTLRLNDGLGNFSGTTQVRLPGTPNYVTLADLDGDGNLDLLVASNEESVGAISVRLNDGLGNFAGVDQLDNGQHVGAMVTADVDSDGDLDLMASNYTVDQVAIWLNDGTGHFVNSAQVNVGDEPHALATGDVDGDGDLDILTANYVGNSVSVRLNDKFGNFSGDTQIGVGDYPVGLVMGDLDGDGDLDVMTGSIVANSVSVRFNQAPLPIALRSFTVQPQGDWVQLFWRTEWETKFAGFQLERSTNAQEFIPISWLAAQANAQAGASYRYNDLTLPPAEATLYYRLKSVDLDGSFSYSTIRSVRVNTPRLSLLALGNPVRGTLRLILSSPRAQAVRLQLVSAGGQIVREHIVSVVEGRSQPELSIASLGAGQYQILASDETTRCVQRIIIE